ncbi:hypothetical protein CONLIGDRAFT_586054 [Coniochaeta ligniaria NRRL 30616]|uniref:Uncharacterized protein n=1 Tax=Coniochaeta ligniaria NRRL 30616 TaxID=1408157 RepID=A0A1J7I708_9PEZI|nr:hypothetical protein CONLIGDRAFT_586054 [Coniochaeta ligniaria NRRL 30616]
MIRECPKGYQAGAFTHVVSEGRDVFVQYRDVPMDEVWAQEATGWTLHLIRSKTPWVKGQLLGPDGAEEAVKNMSPSYLPPERATEEFVESRSATSITHVIMRSRPAGVCPGWGGWDEWLDWQSYGRGVPKDKVVDIECSNDPLKPFRVVNDAGETVETVQPHLATSTLQSTQKLESLYANINKKRDYKTAKPKAKAEPKPEPGRTWTTLL